MAYENLSKEELIALAEKEKNLYYSTKQLTNRTTDSSTILSHWNSADEHWKNYHNILKIIATKS